MLITSITDPKQYTGNTAPGQMIIPGYARVRLPPIIQDSGGSSALGTPKSAGAKLSHLDHVWTDKVVPNWQVHEIRTPFIVASLESGIVF